MLILLQTEDAVLLNDVLQEKETYIDQLNIQVEGLNNEVESLHDFQVWYLHFVFPIIKCNSLVRIAEFSITEKKKEKRNRALKPIYCKSSLLFKICTVEFS